MDFNVSNECPGLDEIYGDEFEALYTSYEAQGKGRKNNPCKRTLGENPENLKLKQERHICCIKMQQTVNQIKRI